jgi:putative FmdB family regulatory protein
MPTYDYSCNDCGDFSALRPMSERNDPLACPTCGEIAQRVMSSSPALASMNSLARSAHATNERAAHAPKTSAEYAASHGAGCSCCSGKASRSTVTARDGSKAFPGKRPWMISH